MMTDSPRSSTQPTVRVERNIAAPVNRVFEAFTAQMDSWWPRSHRLGQAEREDVVLEPQVGGRWYERGVDGSTCDWGRVLEWEPPHRVVLSWQIGVGFVPQPDPERASRIEIRFEEANELSTRVTLTHTDFERHGEGWETMRDSVASEGGWEDIVTSLADAAAGRGKVTEPGTIRFERLLPGPIERVWRFLTESEARGTWLASGEMELREGAAFRLRFMHKDLSPHKEPIPEQYAEFEDGCDLPCRVTRVDPPRLLSHTWEDESEVTYELEPRGDQVLLILTHRRLTDDAMISVASGWHTHLAILADRLAGRDPRPFWSEHARYEEDYSLHLMSVPST